MAFHAGASANSGQTAGVTRGTCAGLGFDLILLFLREGMSIAKPRAAHPRSARPAGNRVVDIVSFCLKLLQLLSATCAGLAAACEPAKHWPSERNERVFPQRGDAATKVEQASNLSGQARCLSHLLLARPKFAQLPKTFVHSSTKCGGAAGFPRRNPSPRRWLSHRICHAALRPSREQCGRSAESLSASLEKGSRGPGCRLPTRLRTLAQKTAPCYNQP